MTSIHDLAAVEALCREGKIDPRQLRRLRNAFYRDCRGATAALEELPAAETARYRALVIGTLPQFAGGIFASIADGNSSIVTLPVNGARA